MLQLYGGPGLLSTNGQKLERETAHWHTLKTYTRAHTHAHTHTLLLF